MLNDPARPVLLVDVRSPGEFREKHIPGAINSYLPDIRGGDSRFAVAGLIVVYGSGLEDDLLATAAVKKLLAFGYQNVAYFPDGLKGWSKAQKH